jgi:hypothetical protein
VPPDDGSGGPRAPLPPNVRREHTFGLKAWVWPLFALVGWGVCVVCVRRSRGRGLRGGGFEVLAAPDAAGLDFVIPPRPRLPSR